MQRINRREMLAGAAGAAALGMRAAVGQVAGSVTLHAPEGDFAGGSKVFALGDVKRAKAANGAERISVFSGRLQTGEALSMHESWAPPGLAPAPLHRITHSEVIVVLEGALEFVHDGVTSAAAAGDVVYVAYGTTHAVRNTGAVTARYMVLQVGTG